MIYFNDTNTIGNFLEETNGNTYKYEYIYTR